MLKSQVNILLKLLSTVNVLLLALHHVRRAFHLPNEKHI